MGKEKERLIELWDSAIQAPCDATHLALGEHFMNMNFNWDHAKLGDSWVPLCTFVGQGVAPFLTALFDIRVKP